MADLRMCLRVLQWNICKLQLIELLNLVELASLLATVKVRFHDFR